jgi:hypothetical protein
MAKRKIRRFITGGVRFDRGIVASLIFVFLGCFSYEIVASHPDFIPILSGLIANSMTTKTIAWVVAAIILVLNL